jgi:hypothetical protein
MNGKEYMTTQMRLIEIGKIADTLDFDGFLKAISNAETVGPIVDPTIYRKAMENLHAIKKLAEAGRPVKTAYGETFKAVMNTAVAGFMEKEKV